LRAANEVRASKFGSAEADLDAEMAAIAAVARIAKTAQSASGATQTAMTAPIDTEAAREPHRSVR
jgi:hypothetical protein